jgi:membrane protease YdiL (CAAX protease family)
LTDQPSTAAHGQVLRAIAVVVCFFLLGLLLFGIAFLPFAQQLTAGMSPEDLTRRPSPEFTLVYGLALAAGFGLATWIIGAKALRLDARALRWRTDTGPLRGFAGGFALGVMPAAIAMTLAAFMGGAAWLRDAGSLTEYIGGVAKTWLVLAPVALGEELMFRGLPLVLCARTLGRPAAIVLLSVLFALAHITNPDIGVRALGNIALAGILLSLVFYSPGGMWAAFGTHLGWNGTLAALGAPVSGLPFDIPYIDYTMGGPEWLTGGRFGPEGGLLSTLTITSAVVFVVQWLRRRPT